VDVQSIIITSRVICYMPMIVNDQIKDEMQLPQNSIAIDKARAFLV